MIKRLLTLSLLLLAVMSCDSYSPMAPTAAEEAIPTAFENSATRAAANSAEIRGLVEYDNGTRATIYTRQMADEAARRSIAKGRTPVRPLLDN